MGWSLTVDGEAEQVTVDGCSDGAFAATGDARTHMLTVTAMNSYVFTGDEQQHTSLVLEKVRSLTPSDPWILLSGDDCRYEQVLVEGDLGAAVDFIRLTGARNKLSDWWVSTDRHGLVMSGANYNTVTDWHIECGSQADDTWDGINLTTSDNNLTDSINVMGDGGANNPRYGVNVTDAASDDNYVCGVHAPDAQSAPVNDAGTDTITCLTSGDPTFAALADGWNGSFVETFDALVTESAGTITMSLEQTGGGDLTMRFSDGLSTLDCTPAATITLTAGTDSVPQTNYIYIPQSTKVLTKSTSDWPAVEHIKVGFFHVPSATFVGTDGCYINQNWNDHASGTDNQGHVLHMTERIRRQGAVYFSGLAGAGTSDYLTLAGTTVDLKIASGVGYQMHRQTISAVDTSTGDKVLVKNWSGDPYHDVTNLYDIVADSTGTSIGTNRYFNLVVWSVANKSGEYSPAIINLPSGTYTNLADAEADVSGYDDFTISREFNIDSSVALLVCRLTVRKLVSSWTYHSTVDLRGSTVASASGGAAAVSSFNDANFEVFNNTDNTKVVDLDVSGVTTATTRTLTVPDDSGIIPIVDAATAAPAATAGLSSWLEGYGLFEISSSTTYPNVTGTVESYVNGAGGGGWRAHQTNRPKSAGMSYERYSSDGTNWDNWRPCVTGSDLAAASDYSIVAANTDETAATQTESGYPTVRFQAKVRATAQCYGLDTVATSANMECRMEISLDGGSTWSAGKDQNGETGGASEAREIPFAPTHESSGAVTGTIQARLRVRSNSADSRFINITTFIEVGPDW